MNCKKICFSSKKQAKAYIHIKQLGRPKIKCRIYKCKLCGGYHYTSMPAWAITKMRDGKDE